MADFDKFFMTEGPRFSGTELVGLDIEAVMAQVSKIKNEDVQRTMEAHTLGIVISFFD